MDNEHVLRIYHDNMAWDYVEARQLFYDDLAKINLPFAVPEIYSVGAWVGHIFTTEKRIHGQDFSLVLPTLEGENRAKALTSYLDTVVALGQVQFPDKPYGELIATLPLQCDSWRDYLKARMEQTLLKSRPDLEADVPGLDNRLAAIYAQLETLGDDVPKSLVHGDYFPANVFMDGDLNICGVVDFSYATIVGDWRQDVAGALWLMGATHNYRPDDTAFLRQLVLERWGAEILAVTDFYKLYYSIYFSGCKADDFVTYQWCVTNLREMS
jgi:Ser/Thr protein kinase RdoA (MazF antagonist)